MSRSGYVDGCENLGLWRGAVASATRGKRGQLFFKELLAALDAMPDKRLIENNLEVHGQYCVMSELTLAEEIRGLLEDAMGQIKVLENSSNIRHNSDMGAIERWKESGGAEIAWLDHTDLVVWLMWQLAEAEKPKTIKAKPIEWEETKVRKHREWLESAYGFYISQGHQSTSRFRATWGEDKDGFFATIEEAKQWCQDTIDEYFSEYGVIG